VAKREVLKAPKPKKQRFTGRAVSVAQIKLGGEPSLGIFPSKMDLVKAFNWYAQCVEPDQRSQFIVAYMQQENRWTENQVSFLEKKGKKFPETWAYISRMLTNGAILEDSTKEQLDDNINGFLAKKFVEVDDEGVPVEAPKPKREAVSAVLVNCINFIEMEIENIQAGKGNDDINFYEELTRLNCSSKEAKQLQGVFDRQLTEFLALYSGKIEDLNEAYAFLKKNAIQRLAVMSISLRKDLESLVNTKKERVVRKRRRKEVPVTKQIARLRFLKESTEFKIASVDPTKVIGAKMLVTFNTKSRMLSIFEASDDKGIQVKGINLINVTSRVKKLRRPQEVLVSLLSGSKIFAKTQFERITTTEYQSNNKPTTDTILLRVFQ
jgi:hypothetical protein